MDSSMKDRIYLDHAATRYPKSRCVIEAISAFMAEREAATGRGVYGSSRHAGDVINRLRREIAAWIGARSDQEISLHAGGTEALNAALLGLLKPGDHVVTTQAEHNSVLRPLNQLASQGTITWTIVPINQQGSVSIGEVLDALKANTRMVAITHASNVNGAVQPVCEIGRRLREKFVDKPKPLLVCDAAQTFGYLPIDVDDWGVDALAAPGHKGGCGPLGTGLLYLRKELHREIRPFIFGGTGSHSESLEMPTDYPGKMEAGNLNTPALAGWLAGLGERTLSLSPSSAQQTIAAMLRDLATQLYGRLDRIDGVNVIGRPDEPVLPVASVTINGLPAAETAMILDAEFGIEVRSGLHCAGLIHDALGSPADGTVRISCSETTTPSTLDRLESALIEIASE